MNLLDSAKIDIPCPHCGRKLQKAIGRLKLNPTLRCPGCHQPVVVDAKQLRSGLSNVDASLKKLSKALGRIGKR